MPFLPVWERFGNTLGTDSWSSGGNTGTSRATTPVQSYTGRVAVRARLDPELQEVVERTRARLAAEGRLRGIPGPYQSPFDEETKAAVLEFLRSGEYRRLVAEIGAEDPEVADL